MLNDNLADRSLPPTNRRRNAARAEGHVAHSREITTALILLAGSLTFRSLAMSSTTNLAGLLKTAFANVGDRLSIGSATERIHTAGFQWLQTLGPVFGAIIVCGLLANLIQTGWLWVPARLMPQLRSSRLLSVDRCWELIMLSVRSTCLAGWAIYFAYGHRWKLSGVGEGESISLLRIPVQLLADLALQLSLIALVLAVIDYGFRFWRHEQSLMMTVEERRRELQDESVAPEIKRRRAAGRSTAPAQSVDQISAVHS